MTGCPNRMPWPDSVMPSWYRRFPVGRLVVAAADARRLAVIAEFTCSSNGHAEHADWVVDDWDAASAEVGAVLNVSLGRASGQMCLALTLRERLPKVGSLFVDGAIGTARSR